ncbi:MAG: hypothetical protein RLZZ282_372 [Verrucomicrobiota bacterium]
MPFNTLTQILFGVLLLVGFYTLVRLTRFLPDFLLVCIVLTYGLAACSLQFWYAPMTSAFGFLPTAIDFVGRVFCLGMLTFCATLLALPMIPFSLVIRKLRVHSHHVDVETQPDPIDQAQVPQSTYHGERNYDWNHVFDQND